jgi:hypothetical protein
MKGADAYFAIDPACDDCKRKFRDLMDELYELATLCGRMKPFTIGMQTLTVNDQCSLLLARRPSFTQKFVSIRCLRVG